MKAVLSLEDSGCSVPKLVGIGAPPTSLIWLGAEAAGTATTLNRILRKKPPVCIARSCSELKVASTAIGVTPFSSAARPPSPMPDQGRRRRADPYHFGTLRPLT